MTVDAIDAALREDLASVVLQCSQYGSAGAGVMAQRATASARTLYGAHIAEQDAELARLRAIEAAAKAWQAFYDRDGGDWDGLGALCVRILAGKVPG